MSDTGEMDAASQPDAGLTEAVRLQRDLYLYWDGAARLGGAPLTARGLVARPSLRRLLEPLGADGAGESGPDAAESERPRAFFLRRALERLGLLRLAGEGDARRLEAAEARVMARYLARSLGERIELLARLWAAGAWWPDHPERGETSGLLTPAPTPVARARRRALEAVGATAPGGLIELAPTPPALERLRRGTAQAVRSGARNRKGSVRSPARPARLGGDESLAVALSGPLAWLGLVWWDAGRAGWIAGLPALTLRGAGDEQAERLAEEHGRVVAQSDLTLIAYAPLAAPELLTLDLCATRETLDQAARYRLTRQSFARARALGWDAAQATARLERLTSAPLPGPMRVALADWERAASRLRLTEGATLLEVPSVQTLDALLADRTGAAWVIRRLTPTAALIHPDDAPHARAWLLRRGHLPAICDETAANPTPAPTSEP
ncbi:MAG TPA: helicase-associated domain-containing protein [Ktedonobacterales bacterium]|nr:helicase-associated domain-containing protein [Ktedonobacterales bacterium]